jgi:hypothetical protein
VVAPAQLGWWKRSPKLSYGPRPPSINGKARAGTSRLHDEWRRSVGSGLLCQHALVTGQPTVSQVAQGYSPIQWNISNSQRPQETSGWASGSALISLLAGATTVHGWQHPFSARSAFWALSCYVLSCRPEIRSDRSRDSHLNPGMSRAVHTATQPSRHGAFALTL